MTTEGLLVFRSYARVSPATNERPDTAICWVSLFQRLVSSGLVPRVLVKRGYPNERCFRLLNNVIPSIYSSQELNYADDLFSSPSYYDGENILELPPGSLVIGREEAQALLSILPPPLIVDDICLLRSGDVVIGPTAPVVVTQHQPAVRKRRDLTQEIVTRTMRRVKETALGRHVTAYVSAFIKGQRDVNLLRAGFDWERYLRADEGGKKRDEICGLITSTVEEVVNELSLEDADDLQHQFREFYRVSGDQVRLAALTRKLLAQLELVPLSDLSLPAQQAAMRFIFRNEHVVWALRGGRPGEETLDSFLDLTRGPIPGVVLFERDMIVGYAVGELTQPHEYEVITTWVHSRFKGQGLAIRIYSALLDLLVKFKVSSIRMDVIEGAVEKASQSFFPLWLMSHTGLLTRKKSYKTEMEQFEMVLLSVRLLAVLMWIVRFVQRLLNRDWVPKQIEKK